MPISPRTEEVPFLLNNIQPGNILNIGGAMGPWKKKLINTGHEMTIIDVRPCQHSQKNIVVINKDIRNVKIQQTGLFDNVILMSTIEHISLPLFSPNKKKTWIKDPFIEQLRVFKHCLTFLKKTGTMIFTVPCGTRTVNPQHKLLYDKDMIATIKSKCTVAKEMYIIRDGNQWHYQNIFPEECYTSVARAEQISDSTGRFASAVCMMILANKYETTR